MCYWYDSLLKECCEEVYCYDEFGSYQGDWFAKVKFKGNIGWVHGCYGSCPYCDWVSGTDLEGEELKKAFIGEYLENLLSQEEAEKEASKYIDFDLDAEQMLAFVRKNAIDKSLKIKSLKIKPEKKASDGLEVILFDISLEDTPFFKKEDKDD